MFIVILSLVKKFPHQLLE